VVGRPSECSCCSDWEASCRCSEYSVGSKIFSPHVNWIGIQLDKICLGFVRHGFGTPVQCCIDCVH
jgi:hypothetical protein